MQFKTLFAAAFFGSAVLAAALPQEAAAADIAGDVPTAEELAALYDETFPGTLETFNTMLAEDKGTACPFVSNLECISNCSMLSQPKENDAS